MGASFRQRAGWQVVASYGDTASEKRAVGQSGILCDLSAQARYIVRGEAAAALVQDVSQLYTSSPPGAASRAVVRDASGKEVGAGWALRLRPDAWWLAIEDPSDQQVVWSWLQERSRGLDCVHTVDVTGGYATFGLCGPKALSTLQKLLAVDPDRLVPPAVTQTRLAGVLTITQRLPGGQDTWLITCPRESAEYLWDALEDAGAEYGILPAGTEAWEALARA
jgi:glycine cleavage system aminomethyltransferase T